MRLENRRSQDKHDAGIASANEGQDGIRDAILNRDLQILDEFGNAMEIVRYAIDETGRDLDYSGQLEVLQVTVKGIPPWKPSQKDRS